MTAPRPTDQAPPPAAALIQMMVGYRVSQIVGAVARLGVVDALVAGPLTDEEIAARLGLDRDGAHRLLRAAATLGVLEERAPREFAIGALGELLRRDAPGSLRAMAIAYTTPAWWLPWGRLTEAVEAGAAQARPALGAEFWAYLDQHPDEGGPVRDAWSQRVDWLAERLPALAGVPDGALVVDVGGGEGRLLAAILRACPGSRGILFDLPAQAERARGALRDLGVADRCQVAGGDFLGSVPSGGDVYVLKEILHNWGDEDARRILENCRRGMARGGRLLLIEQIVPPDGTGSFTHVADLNMLVLLGGRERTAAEYHCLLEQAGLRCTAQQPIPGDRRGWTLTTATAV